MTGTVPAADALPAAAEYRRAMSMRRLFERHVLDAVVVLLLVVGLVEIAFSSDIRGSAAGLVALTVVWAGALLARRRAPVLGPAAAILAVFAEAMIWPHAVPYSFATFMAVMIAAGLLGHRLETVRGRVLAGALVTAAIVAVIFRDPEGSWTNLLNTIPIAGVAFLAGYVIRVQGRRTAELRERADRLERERETEARAAAAEERTRIAREMHDVVAHSLSVMVVQAEAAEAMLDVDPERARRPLAAVQETGRSALTELRRMLGVMREMADEGAALAPQPGLAGLDALVEHVRDAGLPVDLRVEGEPRALPPGIDLSAFRIVQEGLTNALKHAGPARAEVLVRYGRRDLELVVRDDGRGHDPHANGGGHGLVGMRERVALYGGRIAAGPLPAPERGFALTATLPLDAEPSR
jgi:signal transduction histidine kinase